jgi:hypothetical protein
MPNQEAHACITINHLLESAGRRFSDSEIQE